MRIKTMNPVRTVKGEHFAKTTTNKSHRGLTYTVYHTPVSRHGRVDFIATPSAPVPTVVRKPLYEVIDFDGGAFHLTKRQAKKMFGARQVKMALKRSNKG
jgi:hypothetical protein